MSKKHIQLIFKPVLFVFGVVVFLSAGSFQTRADEFLYYCENCHENPATALSDDHIPQDTFKDCFTCHNSDGPGGKIGSKIHNTHLTAMGASNESCLSCHKADEKGEVVINNHPLVKIDSDFWSDFPSKMETWIHGGSLAHAHKNAKLGCNTCHATFDIEETDNLPQKCIECHGGYEKVAKLTEKPGKDHQNPHKHHYPALQCTECHATHDKFHDFCSDCHQFGFSWSAKQQ